MSSQEQIAYMQTVLPKRQEEHEARLLDKVREPSITWSKGVNCRNANYKLLHQGNTGYLQQFTWLMYTIVTGYQGVTNVLSQDTNWSFSNYR